MKNRFAVGLFTLMVLFGATLAQAQKNANIHQCKTANAESLCSAAITCGSASTPCTVTIQKDGDGASATPDFPNAKGNKLFCIKAGTKMNFETKKKNTGFVLDFGPKTPFDKDDSIIGGTKKPDSATAMNPGCYRYSIGACVSGAINGMCGTQMAEMVVVK